LGLEVNSEIVLVATAATVRTLRPVASVFDTITTLSMSGWIVVAFCTVCHDHQLEPNLRNADSACCANCGSDLENASSSISCANTGVLSARLATSTECPRSQGIARERCRCEA